MHALKMQVASGLCRMLASNSQWQVLSKLGTQGMQGITAAVQTSLATTGGDGSSEMSSTPPAMELGCLLLPCIVQQCMDGRCQMITEPHTTWQQASSASVSAAEAEAVELAGNVLLRALPLLCIMLDHRDAGMRRTGLRLLLPPVLACASGLGEQGLSQHTHDACTCNHIHTSTTQHLCLCLRIFVQACVGMLHTILVCKPSAGQISYRT